MHDDEVTLIEVGPRDGLQNEVNFITTKHKIQFINQLSQTGLKRIEVTSLVSSKAIPQLADGETVLRMITKKPNVQFSVLVPNMIGMEKAIALGVQEIAIFTSASESFNQRNIHCSIAESIQRFIPVTRSAQKHQIRIRAYISCALGCPYEGTIMPHTLIPIIEQLLHLGVYEISLGDTIGVGTPKQTTDLIQTLQTYIPLSKIAMHFHDTYGQAIANIYTALNQGIRKFDSSVAGLGGCPYARGASGNVATEDVLYLLHGLGINTGIDIFKIVNIGDWICNLLGHNNQSKVANALLGKC